MSRHSTSFSDEEARMLVALCDGITRGRDLSALARSKPFASLWRKAQAMVERAGLQQASDRSDDAVH